MISGLTAWVGAFGVFFFIIMLRIWNGTFPGQAALILFSFLIPCSTPMSFFLAGTKFAACLTTFASFSFLKKSFWLSWNLIERGLRRTFQRSASF